MNDRYNFLILFPIVFKVGVKRELAKISVLRV